MSRPCGSGWKGNYPGSCERAASTESADSVAKSILSTDDPEVVLEIAASWSAKDIRNALKESQATIDDPESSQDDIDIAKAFIPLVDHATKFRKFLKDDDSYNAVSDLVEKAMQKEKSKWRSDAMKETAAQKKLGDTFKEWKSGELNIGQSDKKVPVSKKGQKQAVAIYLSKKEKLAKRKDAAPLGQGGRFEALVQKLMTDKGIDRAGAERLAAYIGRKKYGNKRFGKLSAKGRKDSVVNYARKIVRHLSDSEGRSLGKTEARLDGHVLTLRNGRKLNITHYPGDTRKPGFLPLRHMYGNIRGTYGQGDDRKALDVYVNNPDIDTIYRVRQLNPTTGFHDENKYFIGFESPQECLRAAYYYMDPMSGRFGGIKRCSWAEL